MSNGPSKRFDGILDAAQLSWCEWRSVYALCEQREEQLTSDRLATLGEAGWGNGAGVEAGDWARMEIIVRLMVGLGWGKERNRRRRLIYSRSRRSVDRANSELISRCP